MPLLVFGGASLQVQRFYQALFLLQRLRLLRTISLTAFLIILKNMSLFGCRLIVLFRFKLYEIFINVICYSLLLIVIFRINLRLLLQESPSCRVALVAREGRLPATRLMVARRKLLAVLGAGGRLQ